MRIRNRPARSVFPPPPDLNLNRSFQPQQLPVQEPPRHAPNHCNRLASALACSNHPRNASEEDEIALDRSSDQLPLASYSPRRSGKVTAKRSSSAAASSDNDDNDNIPRKGRRVYGVGRVQLFPNAKGWKGGNKADGEGNSNEAKGAIIELEPSGKIANKGSVAVKRGPRVGASSEVVEGSRCSRVNGRGWRCGQQTLVGYSLCEHHLGKSRLRSLSSVKNITNNGIKCDLTVASRRDQRVAEEVSDTDDEPFLVTKGKKSRIGTVKARSLSSLLGQTSQANAMSQPSFTSK